MKIVMITIFTISFHGQFIAQSSDFNISETGNAYFAPSVASDSAGNFIVVWTDYRDSYDNGGLDSGGTIYGQRYFTDGTPNGNNFKVSESNIKNSRVPSISMNKSGDFVVSWEANETGIWGNLNVYVKRYHNSESLGPSFKVNDDDSTAAQLSPITVIKEDGSFIITWTDRREGPLYSYAQIYDSNGYPQGKNFRVNTNRMEGAAKIGLLEDGRFFFIWSNYLQLYSADGFAEDSIINIGVSAEVKVFSSERILFCWSDFPSIGRIYAFFYNLKNYSASEAFRVDDDSSDNPKWIISIAKSATGEFIIVWQDHRNDNPGVIGRGDIYAQRYSNNGIAIGTNFKVNHEPDERSQRDPAVIFDGKNFVTVWNEDQTPFTCPVDYSININNIVGTIQSFNNPVPGQIFGWHTVKYCPPSINYNYKLEQNFPNPFNQQTIIEYTLEQQSNVVLEIYTIMGQKVTTLVSKVQPSGKYVITWNGRDREGNIASSGIYLYKLQTGNFVEVKKMMFLK